MSLRESFARRTSEAGAVTVGAEVEHSRSDTMVVNPLSGSVAASDYSAAVARTASASAERARQQQQPASADYAAAMARSSSSPGGGNPFSDKQAQKQVLRCAALGMHLVLGQEAGPGR